MASKLHALVLMLVAVANLLHGSAAQTSHVVGDSTGWNIPPGGAATYTTWAAKETFTVGDTLMFNFVTGQHVVAKVTEAAFAACNIDNAASTITSGPTSVTLDEIGEQYYICTIGNHCSLGMKLAINVQASSTTPPSFSNTPPFTTTPPSPPSTTTPRSPSCVAILPPSLSPPDAALSPPRYAGATSLAAAGLPAILVSVAAVLF